MRPICLLVLWLIATCTLPNSSVAQSARIVDLGSSAFTNAVWYDTENEIAWVGGVDFAGVGNPTMWTIDQVDLVTSHALSSLNTDDYGAVTFISRNGEYVSGETVSESTHPNTEGTIWTFGDWMNPQGTGYLSGFPASQARAISNNGTTSGISNGSIAFRKPLSGSMVQLASLPGGSGASVADAISSDGNISVGNSQNAALNFVAVKWTDGGATATPLNDPHSLFSAAVGVSPDGSLIGGIATDNAGAWSSVWINDELQFINDDQGQRFFGQVNGVTDDGLFVGGGLIGAAEKAFVWHTSWANAMTLEDWLVQNGADNPPSLEQIRDVYHDGSSYHFAVNGTTSSYYVQTNDVDGDVLLGDVNQDGSVDLLDVAPFVDVLAGGDFQAEADCNEDGVVNLLDVDPFIAILGGG